MRVFISVPLPKAVREELIKVQKNFAEFPAKWVEEENLHLTLVFIGKVSGEGREKALNDVLGGTSHKPINLKTNGICLLPSEKKPHLLAAKLTGETKEFSTLAKEVKEALRKREIGFDEKPFRPHITLGRLKHPRSADKGEIKEKVQNYNLPEMKFEAKKIELVESKLTPLGPIYKTLEARKLGRP